MSRMYRSYEEFERDELRSLDRAHVSVDDMLDGFTAELDFDDLAQSGGGGGRRRRDEDDDE